MIYKYADDTFEYFRIRCARPKNKTVDSDSVALNVGCTNSRTLRENILYIINYTVYSIDISFRNVLCLLNFDTLQIWRSYIYILVY